MIRNKAFEEYIKDFEKPIINQLYGDMELKSAWSFYADVERKYDCAGMCEVPMFYLTKDISEGKPTKECIKKVIEATFKESYGFLSSMGLIFLLSSCFQVGMCTSFEADDEVKVQNIPGRVADETLDKQYADIYASDSQNVKYQPSQD